MKRFYTQATAENGAVFLDGKPLNSPAKKPMQLPNQPLAEAIAAEWNAQGDTFDKTTLPLTSFASLALDIAAHQRAELIEELLEYGETDLLFFRDGQNAKLAAQQRLEWNPWINRAQVDFNTRYEITDSIIAATQPAANKSSHRTAIESLNSWQLALLSASVKPSTSLILSWYFVMGALDAPTLHQLSRLEESENSRNWGEDADIKLAADNLLKDLNAAQKFRDLLSVTA